MMTTMHVEASYRVIKHKYLLGTANRRADVLVICLIEYSADQRRNVKTIIVRPMYKRTQSEIARCHQINGQPYFGKVGVTKQVDEKTWSIKSDDKNFPFMWYKVCC